MDDSGRSKGDEWILLDVEKVFTLQFAVLHAASGIYRRRVNFDVQDTGVELRRFEGERRVPFVEVTDQGNSGLHVKLDCAVAWGDCEDRSLCLGQDR